MKRLTMTLLLACLTLASALACELRYSLYTADGRSLPVSVQTPVRLIAGQTYRLVIEYSEDHRGCAVPAANTLFFLDGSQWRPLRATARLVLQAPVVWTSPQPRTWRTELSFVAATTGSSELEIIRECPKGGYRGVLTFVVG